MFKLECGLHVTGIVTHHFAIEHGMVKSCQASNTSSFTMHDTAA